MIVAQDRLAIDRALDSLLSALTLAGLVLAVGCIVAVRYVVWQALSPVNDLARRAQEVGPANLDYRFDIAALPEELQLICQRLNALLERLDQAFARERRFNADIAHELRHADCGAAHANGSSTALANRCDAVGRLFQRCPRNCAEDGIIG